MNPSIFNYFDLSNFLALYPKFSKAKIPSFTYESKMILTATQSIRSTVGFGFHSVSLSDLFCMIDRCSLRASGSAPFLNTGNLS